MTRLTLLELVDALGIKEVPEMSESEFHDASEGQMDADDLFRELLRGEGLIACQEKILRWAHDLYGLPRDKGQ
ncbi:hypothetical protein H8790_04240 [Oscillibacter hominis]|uniref:Uncharacterized protein n=1 Tax=Oscillibacter hominis TaxID=2763056 RepID=A0A7G9B6Q4_9FIRM|nr:hypothetical protein [Oscillibacter hominis]QNL45235.1 hypothetical protein H8790_04240 [Oscillibacter hominis]